MQGEKNMRNVNVFLKNLQIAIPATYQVGALGEGNYSQEICTGPRPRDPVLFISRKLDLLSACVPALLSSGGP